MIPNSVERFSEMFHRFHFQALNTKVELLIWAESQEIVVIERLAVEWFRDTEARFSLDNPDSELHLLNTLAGERCKVSDMMLEVLTLTETYRKVTKSAYNPLVVSPSDPFSHLSLDSDTKSVRLPEETMLDLENIVQNWILQRLADLLQHRMKLKQGLLKVGGSHKVWGRPSQSFDPWLIGIKKPGREAEDIVSLALSEGAVATYVERGSEGDNPIYQCTVIGTDAVECGVWAQVISKLGTEKGMSLLAQQAAHCEALFINADSELHYFGDKASLGTRWNEIEVDYYH
jgi:thiamine biosynthesis lipoprotein